MPASAPGTAVAAQGTVGAIPPSNAIVLFDGSDLSAWVDDQDRPARWRAVDDHLIVEPGRGDIFTRRTFGDFQLHLEFWLPEMPEVTGQDRANSGVYLQGRYELQILDSFGMEPTDDGCGALYKQAAPLWNACRRPGVWQVLDAAFSCSAPAAGPTSPPSSTASSYTTTCRLRSHRRRARRRRGHPGPLRLQDHGCPVRFRNIWIASASV
jgi:hypothetical protein